MASILSVGNSVSFDGYHTVLGLMFTLPETKENVEISIAIGVSLA